MSILDIPMSKHKAPGHAVQWRLRDNEPPRRRVAGEQTPLRITNYPVVKIYTCPRIGGAVKWGRCGSDCVKSLSCKSLRCWDYYSNRGDALSPDDGKGTTRYIDFSRMFHTALSARIIP
jgi:hypothetical protein